MTLLFIGGVSTFGYHKCRQWLFNKTPNCSTGRVLLFLFNYHIQPDIALHPDVVFAKCVADHSSAKEFLYLLEQRLVPLIDLLKNKVKKNRRS